MKKIISIFLLSACYSQISAANCDPCFGQRTAEDCEYNNYCTWDNENQLCNYTFNYDIPEGTPVESSPEGTPQTSDSSTTDTPEDPSKTRIKAASHQRARWVPGWGGGPWGGPGWNRPWYPGPWAPRPWLPAPWGAPWGAPPPPWAAPGPWAGPYGHVHGPGCRH